MSIKSLTLGRSLRLGTVIAVAALTLLVPVTGAQTPVSDAEAGDGPHPAHIHSGTCDTLGDVVVPLTDVADEAGSGERSGPESAHPVKTSRTYVDLPLQDIIDGGHAINVHESADAIDVYIACGDIGGVVVEDEGRMHLIIGLAELNDSGHTGIVWFGEDGDRTEVVISLIEPDDMR